MTFDYTGTKPEFLVTGEVVGAENIHGSAIVPSVGCFYATSLKITDSLGHEINFRPIIANITACAKTDADIAVVLAAVLVDSYTLPLSLDYQVYQKDNNTQLRAIAALTSEEPLGIEHYYSERTQVITKSSKVTYAFESAGKVGIHETAMALMEIAKTLEASDIAEEFIIARVNELVDLSSYQLRKDDNLPIPEQTLVDNLNHLFLEAPKNVPASTGFIRTGSILTNSVTLSKPQTDAFYVVDSDGISVTADFSDLSTNKICNSGDTITYNKTTSKFIYNGEGGISKDLLNDLSEAVIKLSDTKQPKTSARLNTVSKEIDGALTEINKLTSSFDPTRKVLNEFAGKLTVDTTLPNSELTSVTKTWYISADITVTVGELGYVLKAGDLLVYDSVSGVTLPLSTGVFIAELMETINGSFAELDSKQSNADSELDTDAKTIHQAINELVGRINDYRPPIADIKDLSFKGILNPTKVTLQSTSDLGMWINKHTGNKVRVVYGNDYDKSIPLYPDDVVFVIYNRVYQRNDVIAIPYGADTDYLDGLLTNKTFAEGDAQVCTITDTGMGTDVKQLVLDVDAGYQSFNSSEFCHRNLTNLNLATNDVARIVDGLFLADSSGEGVAVDKSTESNGELIIADTAREVNRLNILNGLSRVSYLSGSNKLMLEMYIESLNEKCYPGILVGSMTEQSGFDNLEGLNNYYGSASVVNVSELTVGGVTWIGVSMAYRPTPASSVEIINRFNRLDGLPAYHTEWVPGYIPTDGMDGGVRVNGAVLESDSLMPNWSIVFKKLPNGNYSIEPQTLSLRPGKGGVTVTDGYVTLSNVDLGNIENIQSVVGEHILAMSLDNGIDGGVFIYPLKSKGEPTSLGMVNAEPLNVNLTCISNMHIDKVRVSDTEYHDTLRFIYFDGVMHGVASVTFTYTDGVATAVGEIKKHPLSIPVTNLVLRGTSLYKSVDEFRLKLLEVIGDID